MLLLENSITSGQLAQNSPFANQSAKHLAHFSSTGGLMYPRKTQLTQQSLSQVRNLDSYMELKKKKQLLMVNSDTASYATVEGVKATEESQVAPAQVTPSELRMHREYTLGAAEQTASSRRVLSNVPREVQQHHKSRMA